MKNKSCFNLLLITFISGFLCSCNDNLNNSSEPQVKQLVSLLTSIADVIPLKGEYSDDEN